MGRILLVRSKPVQTTASGQAMLRAARQIRTITAEATRELGGPDAARPLTVPLAANADSLATWLVPALAGVGPWVVFDVQRADESLTADLLRQGTVMAAVTSSASPVPGCSVERLGRMCYRARSVGVVRGTVVLRGGDRLGAVQGPGRHLRPRGPAARHLPPPSQPASPRPAPPLRARFRGFCPGRQDRPRLGHGPGPPGRASPRASSLLSSTRTVASMSACTGSSGAYGPCRSTSLRPLSEPQRPVCWGDRVELRESAHTRRADTEQGRANCHVQSAALTGPCLGRRPARTARPRRRWRYGTSGVAHQRAHRRRYAPIPVVTPAFLDQRITIRGMALQMLGQAPTPRPPP